MYGRFADTWEEAISAAAAAREGKQQERRSQEAARDFAPRITLEELAKMRGERLARVMHSASFLVDGLAWHDRRAPLPAGATVDVLPPFAGG